MPQALRTWGVDGTLHLPLHIGGGYFLFPCAFNTVPHIPARSAANKFYRRQFISETRAFRGAIISC